MVVYEPTSECFRRVPEEVVEEYRQGVVVDLHGPKSLKGLSRLNRWVRLQSFPDQITKEIRRLRGKIWKGSMEIFNTYVGNKVLRVSIIRRD